MRKFRITEVRPDVFHVEVQKQGFFMKYWQAFGYYLLPGIPEYSPWVKAEFSKEEALAFIEAEKSKVPPPVPAGYPKEPINV